MNRPHGARPGSDAGTARLIGKRRPALASDAKTLRRQTHPDAACASLQPGVRAKRQTETAIVGARDAVHSPSRVAGLALRRDRLAGAPAESCGCVRMSAGKHGRREGASRC